MIAVKTVFNRFFGGGERNNKNTGARVSFRPPPKKTVPYPRPPSKNKTRGLTPVFCRYMQTRLWWCWAIRLILDRWCSRYKIDSSQSATKYQQTSEVCVFRHC